MEARDGAILYYWLCGWRIRSQIHLPELMPWQGDSRPVDVVIRLVETVPTIEDAVLDTPWLKIGRDGACLLDVPGVARYWITADGGDIAIVPALPCDAPDIRVFLLGSVFGLLAVKRGGIPLHGSCVRCGDQAVVFCGPSGAGKSTLAAAFWRRGHEVLADDVTVIMPGSGGTAQVWPSFPRLKLWRDAMEGLGLSVGGLERTRAELEKYHLPIEMAFRTEPLPVAAIYHLEEVRDRRFEGIKPLHGLDAMTHLFKGLYRSRTVAALVGGDTRALSLCARVSSTIPCHSKLRRMHDLDRLDELVEGLAQRHGGSGGIGP